MNYDKLSDDELVSLTLEGNHRAFAQIVKRYRDVAFRAAWRVLYPREQDIHDAVQNGFVRIYRGLDKYPVGTNFGGWLYTIMYRSAIDLGRKQGKRTFVPIEDYAYQLKHTGKSPLDNVELRQRFDHVCQAIDSLPDIHREVIQMRNLQGMGNREIAETLEIPLGTVAARIFHARRKLRKLAQEVRV